MILTVLQHILKIGHVRSSLISSSPVNKISTTTMILRKRSACPALPPPEAANHQGYVMNVNRIETLPLITASCSCHRLVFHNKSPKLMKTPLRLGPSKEKWISVKTQERLAKPRNARHEKKKKEERQIAMTQ